MPKSYLKQIYLSFDALQFLSLIIVTFLRYATIIVNEKEKKWSVLSLFIIFVKLEYDIDHAILISPPHIDIKENPFS